MFGRSNWTIFGIQPSSLDNFKKSLLDTKKLFMMSQFRAAMDTRYKNVASYGINPFKGPRCDEKRSLDATQLNTALEQAEAGNWTELAALFGGDENSFLLDGTSSRYGMWFCFNDHSDVADPFTKREQLAYENCSRPFKYLEKEDKEPIEDVLAVEETLSRKQFPVLLDFSHGYVYVESTTADELEVVLAVLKDMGCEIYSLRWSFGDNEKWATDFLAKLYKATSYSAEFEKRAEERTRFSKEQIEKLEDKALEKIVSNYFSMTEVDLYWLGMGCPAGVQLADTMAPISCAEPTGVTTLFQLSNTASLASASVMFQTMEIKVRKDGSEKLVREDAFRVDINDRLNLTEIGGAVLRGFDCPSLKRDTSQEIRRSKQPIEVNKYWSEWLQKLYEAVLTVKQSVASVLELKDVPEYGLVKYNFESETSIEVKDSRS